MHDIQAFAAMEQGAPLEPYSYDPGPLASDHVEIDVIASGLCHSDLSMLDNEWGISSYPLVGGHEVTGRISMLGEGVTHLEKGQYVGLGWISQSCVQCATCIGGSQHHCRSIRPTIAGRHGGFANKVRAQALWALPLPDGLDPKTAGPLFCGGITVFSPMYDLGLLPTDRIAVVGIGGLGHLALKFARAWGCEVTAFTSSMDKTESLHKLGAHNVVNSRNKDSIKALRGHFDMVISTVNVSLPWHNYISALAPKGRFVQVGIPTEPMSVRASSLIAGQKSVYGSDTGSPATMMKMLEFCARHNITPEIETFKMSDINAAIARLKSGQARYRIVLTTE